MSIKQKVQHCTDGERGWEQEARLSVMFRYCCSRLEKHLCWEGNIQHRNSDPLRVAGISTKKEDSETLCLAPCFKKINV